jgi:hypothetical protein
LARAVLSGSTRGYRNHPQLARFSSQSSPLAAIGSYLQAIHMEAVSRGYAFDVSKLDSARMRTRIYVTDGQLEYEWRHLLQKLSVRSPALLKKWASEAKLECHPLFKLRPGPVEPWERTKDNV